MVGDVVARIAVARNQLEPGLAQRLANQSESAKLLAFAASGPEIVRGDAGETRAAQRVSTTRQRQALGALDVHLEKIDALDSVLARTELSNGRPSTG